MISRLREKLLGHFNEQHELDCSDASGANLASSRSTEVDDDCLGCRVVGSITFGGASGYMLVQRFRISARGTPAHKALLSVLSGAFATAAVARIFL